MQILLQILWIKWDAIELDSKNKLGLCLRGLI